VGSMADHLNDFVAHAVIFDSERLAESGEEQALHTNKHV
jgi:hypothetical protein